MLKIVKYLLLLALIIQIPEKISADCVACWKLTYLSVKMNDGKTFKGYIPWNNGWDFRVPEETRKNCKKDSDLIKALYLQEKRDIILYNNILTVAVHENEIIIEKDENKYPIIFAYDRKPVHINPEKISSIEIVDGFYSKYNGAGTLNIITEEFAALLQTKKPYGIFIEDQAIAAKFVVSYNKFYNSDKLKSEKVIGENGKPLYKDIYVFYQSGD